MTHDFHSSLERSRECDAVLDREAIYRSVFPDVVGITVHSEDGAPQRGGVDVSLVLASSSQLLVDEKIRHKNFGDIALEYCSNDQRGTPGWVIKPLIADYIAYIILPAGQVYMLPVPQLQAAWKKNAGAWFERFTGISADNGSYKTLSLPIPPIVLFPAIGSELRGTFEISAPATPEPPRVNGEAYSGSSHWDAEKGHFVW